MRLTIDYRDGVRKQFAIPFREGMTILDAMNAAQASPHGVTFRYEKKDGPETFLLTQIDDLKNAGSGPKKRNWLYRVNDKEGDRSFAVYKLKASDRIIWRFARFHPAKQ